MTATRPRFYQTGGTLLPDAPSYVTRQADRQLYEGLLQGEFCYMLTARQMGKSSLMARTAARLREEGVAVAVLDLTAVGQNLSPEQWYDGLRDLLGLSLDLEDELEEFWLAHARLGPLQRFMAALRQVVLPHVPGRLVIFVDEIDAVRSLPFSTDEFFAAIRECYNRRTEDPEFGRLTFCLLGVASPSDLIRDTRTTPFNIGRRIELTDFSEVEASPLAEGLGRKEAVARALLERVLYWTGGHPYLTQRLCQAVSQNANVSDAAGVDRLCEALFLSPAARERDDNLLFVRERLQRSEGDLAGLLDLYLQVRRGKWVPNDETNPLVSLLRLAGITRVAGAREAARGTLQVRNRIYNHVFDPEWVRANMPDAELRRQRAAYRRGLLRATAVAGVILAMFAALALAALTQARRADRSSRQARASAREAQQASARAQHLAAERQVALVQLQGALRETAKERDRANREAGAATQAQGKAESARRRADESARLAKWQEGRANVAADRARRAASREARQRRLADQQRRVAEEQRHLARKGERTARRNLYAAQINLAQQAWEAGNVGRAIELLKAQRPRPGEEDLRGFEWRYLWRLCQGGALFTFHGHKEGATVAFSPDGRTLASGSYDHTAKLWDTATRRQVATLTGHAGPIESLSFSPDGLLLASGSHDKTSKLWSVATRREVATLKGHGRSVYCVAFSPDGKTLATGSWDHTVKLWDVTTRQELATLRGHKDGVQPVAFSPNGKLLASGSRDNTVKLWDLATRREFATLKGPTGHIESAAFSPDGRLLATAGQDNLITLWDVATKREVASLAGHVGRLGCVRFSPDGRLLASGSEDSTIKLWDASTHREVATLKGHLSDVMSVAFSPDGRRLASGSADTTVKLWEVDLQQDAEVLTGHTLFIHSIAFSPDGRTLASGGTDTTVRLWDVPTARELAILQQRTYVLHLAFSPDGKILAINSSGLRFWDTATWREVARMGMAGSHAAFSPDGKMMATGRGRSVALYDLATKREVAVLKGDKGSTWSVAFSHDGRLLAAGSAGPSGEAGEVRLWNVAARRAIAILREAIYENDLAFSPDGKLLATGSLDKTVKLWDTASGRQLATLKGHSGPISGLAFSPDGKTLASGSMDSTLKLWNVVTSQEVATLKGHRAPIAAVAFSPDGNTLATAGGDKTVRLWRAATFAETDPQVRNSKHQASR